MKKLLIPGAEKSLVITQEPFHFSATQIEDRSYASKVIVELCDNLPTCFLLQLTAYAIRLLESIGYSRDEIVSGDPKPKPNQENFESRLSAWESRNQVK